MNLVEEFCITVSLKQPLPVGDGPVGTRMYFEVGGGEIYGDRVKASIMGGGEWALVGPDGFLRPDVRLQAETEDGAFLYIQYVGLLGMNEAVQTAMTEGRGTEYDDQYWYTNPRIETGDSRYAWLNTTFFIAKGRVLPNLGVEYQVWRPD